MGKPNTSSPNASLMKSVRVSVSHQSTMLLIVVALTSVLILFLRLGFEASANSGAQKVGGLQGGSKPTGQIQGSTVAPTKTAVVNFLELAAREATNPPVPKLPKTHEVEPVPETHGNPEEKGPPAVEPKTVPPAPTVPSPAPTAQFQSLTDNNTFIPPDVHGAAGPNHLMTTLNTQMLIQNKSGAVTSTLSTFTFWSPLGIGTLSDPRVLYDQFNNRWMQTIIVDFFGPNSSICVAVSQTNDPTGSWNLFRVDVDSTDMNWADFPSIGFNKNWIVVSVNMYPVPTGDFVNAKILACGKLNLYNNLVPPGTFQFFALDPLANLGGTVQPAVTMDNTTSTEYFVNHQVSSSGTARIFTLTGSVGSGTLTNGPMVMSTLGGWTYGDLSQPDRLPQMGAVNVSHDEPRWRSVVFRNGAIWGCQQILLPAGGSPNRSSVQWWQLTTAGAVTQMGRIDDPTGAKSFGYPSIAVNKNNDVLIGYSRFSATQFPSANYAFRAGTDPLGTLRDDRVLKAGENCYVKTFGGGHNRWGDYSMTCVDPVNDFDMWTIQEYAATASGPGCGDGTGMWATWWGKIAGGPTQADLTTFSVKGYDRGQFLEWQTSRETDNLGFNLYRNDRGRRIKINPELIAGSALVTGQIAPLSTGRNYGWWDNAAAGKGTEYWLEEVSLRGESKWHGPAGFENVGGSPPSQSLASTLSNIGSPRAVTGVTRPVERKANLPRIAVPVSPLTNLASQPAVKIYVKQEGIYKVTQPQLVAAGLAPNINPQLLQLYVDGQQQAITVAGEGDGSFDASDWLEFYGIGLDVPSTDTRVYWLTVGSQPGLRISQSSAPGSGAPSGSFPYTVERKDRGIYFSSLLNGDKENFFGAVIVGSPLEQSLSLQNVDTAASTNAVVEVAVQGVTYISHSVNVAMNGVTIGQVNFDYLDEGIVSFPISHSMLVEGENVVTLNGLNGPSDVNLVDYIRITYRHRFNADGNALRFTAAAGQPVSIGGFNSGQIRVFDVTSADSVQELIGTVSGGGSNFVVSVTPPGTGSSRTLLAIAIDQLKTPTSLRLNQPSSWRVPARGADLLIFGNTDILGAMDLLKQHRQSEGLAVSMVDIEDVYDEFSFGQRTPQALKDFLQYTATTWKKKPRFALFAGDASFDPRNYMGFGDFDFVPSKLIDTAFMETSSDDWFADFDGDGIPELALGRFPVRTAQEAELIVQKIFAYEKSSKAEGVLLVADTNDIYDFEGASNLLLPLLPLGVKVEVVNRGQINDDSAVRSEILAALNQGQRIVNYTGHGNIDQWRGSILLADDAAALINDRHLSLFVLMTCLNGYFNDPTLSSIAETMLKAPKGGAAAVWASTGQCGPSDQAITNQEFYRLIFNGDPVTGKFLTLGEAAVKAKRAISDLDVRRTWVLFGDPTMRFK
ncbi:MAG TPA: C25 family cysteine peptidase [Blastocatellia bacterium]|nr:C25 family cysteine peptidase [Blastocatellia bacterium]